MTVHRPRYGRFLEEYRPGDYWWHPRPVTIGRDLAYLFAATFGETSPRYLSDLEARRAGYAEVPVHPLLLLSTAIGMGVENDSEQTLAHLAYHDVRNLRPFYPGSTLWAATRVAGARPAGDGDRGVVRLETVAVNEERLPVIRYERSILVPAAPLDSPERWAAPMVVRPFPQVGAEVWQPHAQQDWPGPPAVEVGDVVLHPGGRAVTDEHIAWSLRTGNTHPLHFDRHHAGLLGTGPVVAGPLVLAWVAGLASRDVAAAAICELGIESGAHPKPVHSGGVLYAGSRIDDIVTEPTGVVITTTLVGLTGIPVEEAWDEHGTALFEPEREKPEAERIAGKCVEARRRFLYRPEVR